MRVDRSQIWTYWINWSWVTHSLKDLAKNDETKTALIRFWTTFYNSYESSQIYAEHKQSQSAQYKDVVFDILNNGKEQL